MTFLSFLKLSDFTLNQEQSRLLHKDVELTMLCSNTCVEFLILNLWRLWVELSVVPEDEISFFVDHFYPYCEKNN